VYIKKNLECEALSSNPRADKKRKKKLEGLEALLKW
jgi:hypothetical protein